MLALVFLTTLFSARVADAHLRPHNLWTVAQAQAIKIIRGTRLDVATCEGIGPRRTRNRHFSCVGKIAPSSNPARTVQVTYILHPLGRYLGRRAAYVTTNVRFAAFGVP